MTTAVATIPVIAVRRSFQIEEKDFRVCLTLNFKICFRRNRCAVACLKIHTVELDFSRATCSQAYRFDGRAWRTVCPDFRRLAYRFVS